jgi:hypothetical protein
MLPVAAEAQGQQGLRLHLQVEAGVVEVARPESQKEAYLVCQVGRNLQAGRVVRAGGQPVPWSPIAGVSNLEVRAINERGPGERRAPTKKK